MKADPAEFLRFGAHCLLMEIGEGLARIGAWFCNAGVRVWGEYK